MNEAAAKRGVGKPVPLETGSSNGPTGDPDVIVVGAGSAGIAAARHLIAHGLTVTILEARDRIGGWPPYRRL